MAIRSILSSLAVAASLAGTQAAILTNPYTDEATGISFTQKIAKDYSFGLALPENPTTDFIGRISANTLTGWAGAAFTDSMRDALLLVTWHHEGKIVSSLRVANNYALPKVIEGGPTLQEIASNVNETGYEYTFLCKNCIGTDEAYASVKASEEMDVFGWAIATTSSPSDPADPGSAIMQHDLFNMYSVDVKGAKNKDFETWAAKAKQDAPAPPTSGTEGGNSTLAAPVPFTGTVSTYNTTYDYIVVGGGE